MARVVVRATSQDPTKRPPHGRVSAQLKQSQSTRVFIRVQRVHTRGIPTCPGSDLHPVHDGQLTINVAIGGTALWLPSKNETPE